MLELHKLPSSYILESNSYKISSGENWGYLYDLVFPALIQFNQGPIKVLELGVSMYGEGSGHAFSQMPYIEKYVGVDIEPIVSNFHNNHIFIHGDCDAPECINRLQFYAPFDLIIHDADHTVASQTLFFREYVRLLKKPGIMLVENVYNHEAVLKQVQDATIHIIDVPPVDSVYTKCLAKFNF